MSTGVHIKTINFGDLTPYLTYSCIVRNCITILFLESVVYSWQEFSASSSVLL
jgi:hypothetical protein